MKHFRSLPLNIKIYGSLSCGILIAILALVFSDDAQNSALLMGDFPAFYSLGRIILEGESSKLYDLTLQTKIQNYYWPGLSGGVLIAVYPPIVAILMLPLSMLSPLVAKFIFTLLSVLALLLSLKFALKKLALNRQLTLLFACLLITNPFILIGTLGGQNTAFSLLIVSLATYLLSLSDQTHRKAFQAGLIFSMWLYKPQFGLLILFFLISQKLWKVVYGFIFGSLFHYLAGIITLGVFWPLAWLKKISEFSAINYFSNPDIHTSLIGLLQLVNIKTNIISQETAFSLIFPATFSLTILILYFIPRTLITHKISLFSLTWIYIAFLPLIAPQTQFYDIGLPSFALLVISFSNPARLYISAISAVWGLSWFSVLLRPNLSWILFPLITLLIVTLCILPCLKSKYLANQRSED